MDKALAARRLSAALGRKVAPEDVVFSTVESYGLAWTGIRDGKGGLVTYWIAGGNVARDKDGGYWKNGKRWKIKDHDPKIRLLAEEHVQSQKPEPVQSTGEWPLPYREQPPDDRTARQQAPVERAPDNDPEGG